jgi:glycosyltransferase involved in cell wall biosynthesis
MNAPLRIAHIDTERTWRGGEQQAFSLIRGLTARGHKNFSIVRKGAPLAHRLHDHGEEILRVSPWGEWDVCAAAAVRVKLRQEKIDIVHAHTGHAVALAALATRGTTIPFVLTRRVDFHLSGNLFSRWKYKRAAKIVSISDGVRKILLDDGIPESQITVIPSGVDFTRFQGVAPVSRASLNIPSDAIIIGQVAALADHKDYPTFLKAIEILRKEFSNVRAVIVGEGELKDALKKRSAQLGLQNTVSFLGFRLDALNILAALDVFCLSSKEEGLGTSVLDAMALGVPVVATRAGGIPEMVADGKTGYLAVPRDPQSLADALKRAIQNRANNKEILKNALDVAKKFDIKETISRTESLYRQLLSSLQT